MAVEANRPKLGQPRIPNVNVTLHIHAGPSDMARSSLEAAAGEGKKQDKREAGYEVVGSGTGEDNCGRCKYSDFTGIGGVCQKVAGEVRRGYVCRLFESATLEQGGHP